MPQIPISYSSDSCCRRCLRCANDSSRSLFTLNLKSAFSRGFSFRKLQILISQTTDFHFVSFHFLSLHFVSQTTVSPSDPIFNAIFTLFPVSTLFFFCASPFVERLKHSFLNNKGGIARRETRKLTWPNFNMLLYILLCSFTKYNENST